MKCPIDGAALVMSERQGVEIDYCPTCRGVWLDRGELDKILDRAAATAPAAAAPGALPGAVPPAPQDDYGRQHYPPEPYADVYKEPYRGGPYHEGQYQEGRYQEGKHREGKYRDGIDPRTGRPYKKRKESWLSDILDFD